MQQPLRASASAVQQPRLAATRCLSITRSAEAGTSGRRLGHGVALPRARALPLRAARPQQQQLAVCSLTSHPGEVSGAPRRAAGSSGRDKRVGAPATTCRAPRPPSLAAGQRLEAPLSAPGARDPRAFGRCRSAPPASVGAAAPYLARPPLNARAPPPPSTLQERSGTGDLLPSFTVPSTGMAKNLGSSGGSATMQRSKLSNKQAVQQVGPKLDDGMGGGGLGKGIFNGGGGDGDGGDDDDYFNEFGGCCMPCCLPACLLLRSLPRCVQPALPVLPCWPSLAGPTRPPALTLPPPASRPPAGDGDGDGDGDGFFRKVFQELYDAKAINAVLQEWFKTMADMPLILRQAAQMGLFSSAALVRFLAMDVRPNVTRFVTRSLPPAVSGFSPRPAPAGTAAAAPSPDHTLLAARGPPPAPSHPSPPGPDPASLPALPRRCLARWWAA